MKKLLALLSLTLFAGAIQAQNSDQSETGLLRFEATAGLYTTKDIRNNLRYDTPDVWGKNSTGSFFANISFFRYRKTEVSFAFGYQEGKTEAGDQMDVTYLTFMPQARINWVTSSDKLFELYSTLGFGITSVKEDDQSAANNDVSYMVPAFHINGIGMRFGNQFGFFMELGFGAKGLMSAGLSYRL